MDLARLTRTKDADMKQQVKHHHDEVEDAIGVLQVETQALRGDMRVRADLT